jgi:signal transduction histidine kinase
MNAFFNQIFSILTSETGSLTYHLVLAFSVAAALQAAFMRWRSAEIAHGRRPIVGLVFLLIFRLALFIAAGLAWQGVFNASAILPPVDRAAALLSLLLIVWLWAFPEPVRAADAAVMLLFLLTLSMFILGMFWWSGQAATAGFNGSIPDVTSNTFAALLAGLGIIILLVRKPSGWGVGLGMLGLLFTGRLLNLLIPPEAGDFSGLVRLTEMAAYPLLLVLPQPVPAVRDQTEAESSEPAGETAPGPDWSILYALLSVGSEGDPAKIYRAVAVSVGQAMSADVCLVLTPPDSNGMLAIQSGYDLTWRALLPPASIETSQVPHLASAISRGRSLRPVDGAVSPDRSGLTGALNLPDGGDMMAVTVSPTGGEPFFAIVLLTPYTRKTWTAEDRSYLASLSQSLAQLMERTLKNQNMQGELGRVRDSQDIARLESERDELLQQLNLLRKASEQDKAEIASLSAMLSRKDEAKTAWEKSFLFDSEPSSEVEQLEGELRLSLEEVARLQSAMSDTDQKILELEKELQSAGQAPASPVNPEQLEKVRRIAGELRQPLSSMVGYTDFLLGETVGILGNMQRKFLERIKASNERMARLVDDLLQAVQLQTSDDSLPSQQVDVKALLDTAAASASEMVESKHINLRLEVPEGLPPVNTRGDSLRDVLAKLVKQAGQVTAPGGTVTIKGTGPLADGGTAREGQNDYLLLQVSDEGGGIPPEELPRVFSSLYRLEGAAQSETPGSGCDMLNLRARVESLGGRIWVDSELGRGSTFSLLLPISKKNGKTPSGPGANDPPDGWFGEWE